MFGQFKSTKPRSKTRRNTLNSDECLAKAGGLSTGTIDFVQVHSYAHGGSYGYVKVLFLGTLQTSYFRADAAFSVPRSHYADVTKPILIGEFSSAKCQQQKRTTGWSSHFKVVPWTLDI